MRIAYAAMSYTCGFKHLCGRVRYVLAAKIRYRNIFNPCLSKIGQKGAKIGKNSLKKAQNVFVLNHSDMLATKKIRHMAIPSFDGMHKYTAIIFKSAIPQRRRIKHKTIPLWKTQMYKTGITHNNVHIVKWSKLTIHP